MSPRPAALPAALAASLLAAALVTSACASGSAVPGATPPGDTPRTLSANETTRERALQQAIEADRRRLEDLIAPPQGKSRRLHDDPELIEIAERLPRLEEELRQLKEAQSTPANASPGAKAP